MVGRAYYGGLMGRCGENGWLGDQGEQRRAADAPAVPSGRGRYKIETANTKEGQLNVCVPLMATKIGISYSNKHC